jgi:uncharacterized membrane protein
MAQPAKPIPPRLNMLARSGHLEYDRVLFFSDAIFAIAITLLVIDIRVPGITNAADELSRAKGNILSFGISFVVIGCSGWVTTQSSATSACSTGP